MPKQQYRAVLHTITKFSGGGYPAGVACGKRSISIRDARAGINAARKYKADVQVHETTDRDGTPLHVAYAHYGPGTWDNAAFSTEIYEIPTAALTDL
ncbi:hypothetical protein [Streptomyces litchfieldiae]|uniref:Uncharacterized protein n=1 Tax=Streptomyces litchfieldiae TaxID=3075543 RepID=A0ABU2N0V7_9ACTN|nr:hypothetical protein [Streptomyces sp. DSM 44938]MDT0347541.1 hypothetical protein [Streptomyces sp. DSM 44938]